MPPHSELGESGSGNVDLDRLDSALARGARLLGDDARRRADVQRAPVATAQHACERAGVGALDLLDDLAAFAHAQHAAAEGAGGPDCAFGIEAHPVDARVSGLELGTRPMVREAAAVNIERADARADALADEERAAVGADRRSVR